MNAVVIKPKNEKELLFVSEFLMRMKITLTTFSSEELEDIGLGKLMKDVDRTKKVSRAKVMKKLNS